MTAPSINEAIRRDFECDQHARFNITWLFAVDTVPLDLHVVTARWRNDDDSTTDVALAWNPTTGALTIDTVFDKAGAFDYDILITNEDGDGHDWYFLEGRLQVRERSTP